jgi:hypothetical protein
LRGAAANTQTDHGNTESLDNLLADSKPTKWREVIVWEVWQVPILLWRKKNASMSERE